MGSIFSSPPQPPPSHIPPAIIVTEALLPVEDASISESDSGESIQGASVETEIIEESVGGDGDSEIPIIVSVWKNPSDTASEELIVDGDRSMYVSGSASINLDPTDRRKKKRCRCFCCRRRHRKSKGGMGDNPEADNAETAGANDDDDSIQSLEEVLSVVIPSEVFPLEMVASLEITPSEIKRKPVRKRRTRIVEKPDKPMSLWGLLKTALGKELSKVPLPVNFCEPLSMLQRQAELFEYTSILDKASQMTDPLEQLASVAAYTVSTYATCDVRTAKPFNPLLGETYECDRMDDFGWRFISEQVCHHPPVFGLHCESVHGWVQWQQFTMVSKFRGNYLEIHPVGVTHLRFKTSENHYTWGKPSTIVRNLVVGKLYIEQEGDVVITNNSTNEKCNLKYSAGSFFSRDRSVTGRVFNSSNVPKLEISGSWDSEITVTKIDASGKLITDQSKLVWTKNPLPSDAEKYYFFSKFTCQLNEMEDGVAPTDSRHRPDQRFMENGLWDEANVEKQRLEDKQRESRKQRLLEANTKLSTGSKLNTKSVKSGKMPPPPPSPQSAEEGVEPYYTPCWFVRQRDPITGIQIHMYNGEYWNCKETQDWERCARLYDK